MDAKYTGVIAAAILAAGYAPATAQDPVAARNIRAGAVLLATDIETPEDDAVLRLAANFIGQEAVRTIYRGQPIHPEDLKAPTLVERNAVVTMEFAQGALNISTEGRALDEGGLGERIRVMNLASRRVVSAVVVSTNTVRTRS